MDWNSVDAAAAGMDGQQLARIGEHLEGRYLAPGKVAGTLTAVLRRDKLAYMHCAGESDRERGVAMTPDTLFRIYSMSKPITSLALMTLWERGMFSLDDPVRRYIPQFAGLRVWEGGVWPMFQTRATQREMTIRDLLRHTAGFTYDFMLSSNIDAAYRELDVGRAKAGYTLEHMIEELATLPLEFSPGDHWGYSIATDVVGYLIERLSGESLPGFLQKVVFDPLGMVDTGFTPREDQLPRLASCYMRDEQKRVVLEDDAQDSDYVGRTFFSGGGGLLSTVADYLRFSRMLLNGGSLDGQRIIGRRTLDLMIANHLPGGGDLASLSIAGFSETANEGVGFGLGFASKLDPLRGGSVASKGSYYWGGLASTLFWVDPAEELIVVFMTQLMPSRTFNFRGQLEALIYAAID